MPGLTFLPVELAGGAGTADTHWRELDGGACCTGYVSSQGDVTYELMTGWLNMPTFVSQTTIQSFADIGFVTAPIPEPDIYAMMLVAFGLIGWQLRRRRRHVAACRFA